MKSKIKYGFISMLLAVFVSHPVSASPLNNDDMKFAFGDSSAAYSDLGEMALLSDQEMKETEGEWWPYYVGGGRNPWGFLGTALAGGAAGLWNPVRGYASGAAAFGTEFTGGLVSGYVSSNGWW